MPYCKTYTETVVAVTVPIVPVEVEHSCIRSIVIVTTTFEERVVRIDKVSVIVLQVYPHAFRSSSARTKSAYFVFSLFISSVVVLSYIAQITDITLLYCKTYTETVVAVTVSIVPVEEEHPWTRSIVTVTTTYEERAVRIDKVGAIAIPSACFI